MVNVSVCKCGRAGGLGVLKGRNGEGRGTGEASGRGYQDAYIGECGLVK